MTDLFRLVAWNIRAGGGKRAELIADQLIAWVPDLIVLSEYRSTPPSCLISDRLAAAGYTAQLTTLREVKAGVNALLVAARAPLQRVGLMKKPDEPGRWLMAREARYGIAIGAMHIPNQHTGRKPGYHDAVLDLAKRWRGGPALFVGDTNSGQIGIDEEGPVFNRRTHEWFDRLAKAGWIDGFRTLYPHTREFTWYSANGGNGFRLDQVFANRELASRLRDVRHVWPRHPDNPERRDGLSDHAALLAEFDMGE